MDEPSLSPQRKRKKDRLFGRPRTPPSDMVKKWGLAPSHTSTSGRTHFGEAPVPFFEPCRISSFRTIGRGFPATIAWGGWRCKDRRTNSRGDWPDLHSTKMGPSRPHARVFDPPPNESGHGSFQARAALPFGSSAALPATVHGPVGDWSIVRREIVFCEKMSAENMDLPPFAASASRSGTPCLTRNCQARRCLTYPLSPFFDGTRW
jgi:hypothetical protein